MYISIAQVSLSLWWFVSHIHSHGPLHRVGAQSLLFLYRIPAWISTVKVAKFCVVFHKLSELVLIVYFDSLMTLGLLWVLVPTLRSLSLLLRVYLDTSCSAYFSAWRVETVIFDPFNCHKTCLKYPLEELDLGYSIFANDLGTCSISLQSSEIDKYVLLFGRNQEVANRGG